MTAALDAAVVERALATAGAVVDVAPLRAAWEGREAPPVHLRVVGRRSVGKSCLVAALTGQPRPTGLGGVTGTDEQVSHSGAVVTDTVAMEEPLAAADALAAALPALDAIVWVVDGLQPLTGVERAALDDAVPPKVAVHVVVSRLDLVDPDERAAILQRVEVGSAHRDPLTLAATDPRSPEPGVLDALRRVPWRRSPRRLAALSSAAHGLATVLDQLDLPDVERIIDEASTAWRERVGDHHDAVVAEVKAGRHLFRDEAALSLHGRLDIAARVMADEIEAACGAVWRWRPAEPEALDVWGQAQDMIAGTPGVLRALRGGAASWATEGSLALTEFGRGPTCAGIATHRAAIGAARAAVSTLVVALSPE